jgi:hypothetical protein
MQAIYNADPARIQNAFKGLVPYFATSGIYLLGNTHIQPFTNKIQTLLK